MGANLAAAGEALKTAVARLAAQPAAAQRRDTSDSVSSRPPCVCGAILGSEGGVALTSRRDSRGSSLPSGRGRARIASAAVRKLSRTPAGLRVEGGYREGGVRAAGEEGNPAAGSPAAGGNRRREGNICSRQLVLLLRSQVGSMDVPWLLRHVENLRCWSGMGRKESVQGVEKGNSRKRVVG